jgi:hypothetical protein
MSKKLSAIVFLIFFCTNSSSLDLTAEQKEWLDQNEKHSEITKLESDMMKALSTKNKAWIDETANNFLKKNGALIQRISKNPPEKQDEALVVYMGSCHYANLTLNQAIVTLSKKYKKIGNTTNPSKLIPIELREQYTENIRRCERLKKIKFTEREFDFEE